MKTTRITIETETLIVIRRAQASSTWCPECRAQVDVISLHKDGLTELATEAHIQEWLDTGKLHLWKSAGEAPQICVTSLLQCFGLEKVPKAPFA